MDRSPNHMIYSDVTQKAKSNHSAAPQNGFREGAYRKPISLIELHTVPSGPPPEPPPDYDDPPGEQSASGKYCFICCACCGPRAAACGSHWRTWLKYTFYGLYAVCILVAIPVMVVVYKHEEKNPRTRIWMIGGIFVFLSIPISLQLILLHLINYTKPNLQIHIIRILWMPPIYAMDSWLSLRFPEGAIYCDTIRELYEAYVIYNFLKYLMNYLEGEYDLVAKLDAKPEAQKHIFPVKYILPTWKPAKESQKKIYVKMTLHFELQNRSTTVYFDQSRHYTHCIFVLFSICQHLGVYDEGNWKFVTAYPYLAIVNNISQTWALYCLVLFYEGMKDELKPIGALPKFLCIKLVVFATFWQGILISVVLHFTGSANQQLIPEKDEKHFSTALQDLLVCIEMIFAAIAHHFAFSHKPYINKEARRIPFCESFFRSFDVRDVAKDVAKHAKEIAGDETSLQNGGQDNRGMEADEIPTKNNSTTAEHR